MSLQSIADRLDAEVGVRQSDDPNDRMADRTCESCGADIPWEYLRIGTTNTYKWCFGGGHVTGEGTLCVACAATITARKEAALQHARINAAGIPARFRHASWWDDSNLRRMWVKSPSTGEETTIPLAGFVAGVRAEREKNERVLGVGLEDRATLQKLRAWKPEHGSMYIEGMAGTGKTMAACALANDMLAEPSSVWCVCERCVATAEHPRGQPMDRHDMSVGRPLVRHRGGASTVRFTTESKLVSNVRAKIGAGADGEKPKDQVGLAMSAKVLVLDELGGAIEDANGKVNRLVVEVIQEVLQHRYDALLPTIFTSNFRMDTFTNESDKTKTVDPLGQRYGDRVATRIREIVGPRRFILRTPWRM